MSPEEQDAIVGKTVREKAALERELATTDKLLKDIAAELITLAREIDEWTAPVLPAPGRSFGFHGTLQKYADVSKISELVKERTDTWRKLQDVISHLSAMGVR